MKKISKSNLTLRATILTVVLMAILVNGIEASGSNDSKKQLATIEKDFGPVLKLKGTARKEINAIANLLAPGSKLAAIDITSASGEYCMLEKATKHNMIHFSGKPETTREDIVYYLNPKTFIENGLDVSKLPKQPRELGKMVPLKWYYYDGTYVEPHQGTQMNKEFVIMTVNVK